MPGELVSVIIPTYNRAYCVCRAIESALTQTHSDVEVLVIDDGSTDDTENVIRRKYGGELRLRYLHQNNAGVAEARNAGIRLMQGEFAAFLDSDDAWYRWKLEAQLAVMRRLPEVGLIWTDVDAVDLNGRVTRPRALKSMFSAYQRFSDEELFSRRYSLKEFAPSLEPIVGDATVFVGEIYSQMIAGNLVLTSSMLMRRERMGRVGSMRSDLSGRGEDYEYSLRLCREGPVAFSNLASVQYQTGLSDHLSGQSFPIAVGFVDVVTDYLKRDRARIQLSEATVREILAEGHRWVGEEALKVGELTLARAHALKSLNHVWRQPRLVAVWAASFLPFNLLCAIRRAYRRAKRTIGLGKAMHN